MKILHIHLRNDIGTNEGIPRALQGISSKYQCVDWLRLEKRNGAAQVNAVVIAEAVSLRPDLVFYQTQSSDILTTQTVDELRSLGACVMGWSGDVRAPLPGMYTKLGPHVSVSLFSNYPDVEEMRGQGFKADYMNIGYEDRIYRYDGPKSKCPPIVFLGGNYGNTYPNSQARRDMVVALRKEFGKDFEVYGGGWGTRFLNPPEEAAVYRSCKVAVNQEHFTREGFNSDRTFRAHGCGAPLVEWDGTFSAIHVILNRPDSEEVRKERAAHTACTETWEARMPRILELYEQHRHETHTVTQRA